MELMEVMKRHFVLVHGACHGAWCWYKLTTLLRSGGHRVTALDLSASGIDPKQARDLQSVSDYSQPLMKFMDSLPTTEKQKVILVAHSFGGVSVSEAMESYPEKISVAVFITAWMPSPELSVSTLSLEDFTLATMLARPMPIFGENDPSKEVALTHERYGSVSRVYIVADEDKAANKDLQGWMIEKNPTNEVKEITGADHMVMLSKPRELFSCLQEIAANYN